MNECCRDEIQPSLTLKRMLTLLKIILIIHVLIIMVDILFVQSFISLMLIGQILMSIITFCTKHFGYYLYIIICLFLVIYGMIYIIGACFQTGFALESNKVKFCFYVFILVFEIFFIYVIFQLYKQSKHEYRIQYGFAAEGNDEQNNNNEELEPFQPI